ncbi:MAG: phosphomannomutase/phosphoglucomutase [Candidatus Micrarchaeia archaeon]
MDNIFRAYDIRGIYGTDLDDHIAVKIGKAYCAYMGKGCNIAIGRDVRVSSNTLSDAVISGIRASGCNVIDIGTVPSPVLYYSVRHLKLDGGVMVTASHLPPEWNGFKFCDAEGITLSEQKGIQDIKNFFLKDRFFTVEQGQYMRNNEIRQHYVTEILNKVQVSKMHKVVFDYGNSVTAVIMPEIIKKLGIQAYEINKEYGTKVSGRVSELTDESLKTLSETVLNLNADLGIAYDGDGDRVAFVDENGKIYSSGNILIPVFAEYILKKHKKGRIVIDITCSSAVSDYIKHLGGETIVTRVGHSFVANEVLKNRALMGGQYSGHMCFADWDCLDDAIYSSLKMLEILTATEMKLSELISKIPVYPTTKMKDLPCPDNLKFSVIKKVTDIARHKKYEVVTIDGVKIVTETGWVLIRASNTAPIIRVNAEGKSIEQATMLQSLGEKLVEEVMNQ